MAANAIQRLRGAKREAHARGVLGRLASSGLSKAGFCRKEGISTVTYLDLPLEVDTPIVENLLPSLGGFDVEEVPQDQRESHPFAFG